MLYDNGQIVEYLANLWGAGFEEPAFERAIAQTVEWLKREMTSPQGYFYAAQDADSFVTPSDVEPEEGVFYVWHYQDLSELLSEAELNELAEQFTITADGNFEGQNVLQRRQPTTQRHDRANSEEAVCRPLWRTAGNRNYLPACSKQPGSQIPKLGRTHSLSDRYQNNRRLEHPDDFRTGKSRSGFTKAGLLEIGESSSQFYFESSTGGRSLPAAQLQRQTSSLSSVRRLCPIHQGRVEL